MNPVKLKQIWWLISTGMILGSFSDVSQLARAAVNPVLRQQSQPLTELAQAPSAQAPSIDTGCRQTNTSTGVYSQHPCYGLSQRYGKLSCADAATNIDANRDPAEWNSDRNRDL